MYALMGGGGGWDEEKLDNESDTVTLVLPVVVLILGRLAYTQNEAFGSTALNGRKTLPAVALSSKNRDGEKGGADSLGGPCAPLLTKEAQGNDACMSTRAHSIKAYCACPFFPISASHNSPQKIIMASS